MEPSIIRRPCGNEHEEPIAVPTEVYGSSDASLRPSTDGLVERNIRVRDGRDSRDGRDWRGKVVGGDRVNDLVRIQHRRKECLVRKPTKQGRNAVWKARERLKKNSADSDRLVTERNAWRASENALTLSDRRWTADSASTRQEKSVAQAPVRAVRGAEERHLAESTESVHVTDSDSNAAAPTGERDSAGQLLLPSSVGEARFPNAERPGEEVGKPRWIERRITVDRFPKRSMAGAAGQISSSRRWGSDTAAGIGSNMVGGKGRGRGGARERAAAAAAEIRARGLARTAEVVECVAHHDLAIDNRTLNLLLGVMVGGRAVSDSGDVIKKQGHGGGAADRKPPAVHGAEKSGFMGEDIYDVMLGACVQCVDWKGALAIYHHLSAHGAAAASAGASTTAASGAAATAPSHVTAAAHQQRQHQQRQHQEHQQRMPTSHQFGLVLRACARAGRWQLARDLLMAADVVFVAALVAADGGGGGAPGAATSAYSSGAVADGASAAASAVIGAGPGAVDDGASAAASAVIGAGPGAVDDGASAAASAVIGAGSGAVAEGDGGGAVASPLPPLSPHHPPLATSPAMFTDVITACARSAQPIPALRLLDRLDSHPSPALHADVAAYTAAISACASVGQWENAIRLMSRMQQEPIGKEIGAGMGRAAAASAVPRAYEARPRLEARGKLEVSRKPAVRPNVVTWTAVLSACAMAGRADVAMEVLQRMMREGRGEEDEGKGEVERILRGGGKESGEEEGMEMTGATSATCLDATSDATSDCRPNVVTWTAVLTACARAGEWQQAEALFTQMQTNGVMPNEVSWAALISAYAKGGQWEKAVGALRLIEGGRSGRKEERGSGGGNQKGFEGGESDVSPLAVAEAATKASASSSSSAAAAAATASSPSNPPQSFPLPSAWNAALHACAKAGKWKLLGSLVQEMQEARCPPSVVTYGVLVGGYGRAGQATLARGAFEAMLSAGIRPNAVVCASMVRAYARARQFGQAMKFFEAMPGMGVIPDKYTYTALLWACGTCGQWRRAEEIFERMKRQGCVPDGVTYRTLIESYEMNGEWDKSMEVLEDMNSLSSRLLQRARQGQRQ
ncbi:hypothetical protein CLOP_g5602 [Closterium sp. NIES-67]|nr:hypothetical protein CLOP_g5602 [Closterium sp. NIES-67]